jgi:hypothetical protein
MLGFGELGFAQREDKATRGCTWWMLVAGRSLDEDGR